MLKQLLGTLKLLTGEDKLMGMQVHIQFEVFTAWKIYCVL
jgi:hypothetical protein